MKIRDLKVELYQDNDDEWRWRCFAGNGEQIAKSPRAYKKKKTMVKVLAHILAREHDAELYQDKAGEWRWRFYRREQIAAISSEGYKKSKACRHASNLFLDATL